MGSGQCPLDTKRFVIRGINDGEQEPTKNSQEMAKKSQGCLSSILRNKRANDDGGFCGPTLLNNQDCSKEQSWKCILLNNPKHCQTESAASRISTSRTQDQTLLASLSALT